MLYRLIHEEGLCMGASSALNVVSAYDLAKKLGPGKTVVTILCDTGLKYATRIFNQQWLESKQLLEHIPEKWRGGISSN